MSSSLNIAQVLPPRGSSWGELGYDTLRRGVGGRETAVLKLAEQWALAGHKVTCFVPRQTSARYLMGDGEVQLVPQEAALHVLAASIFDAVVAWECPRYLGAVPEGTLRIVGMQVAHLIEDFDPSVVDRYVCLSPWAADFLAEQSNIDRNMIDTVPNGISLERFQVDFQAPEHPRCVYTSSPDRGLHHMMRLWPTLNRQLFGGAGEFVVGYGARRWMNSNVRWSHNLQADVVAQLEEGFKQTGVTDAGLLGQDELAKLQLGATLMTYSCDTMQPTETGCITVCEGFAARLPVVTTACDCLESEYRDVTEMIDLPFDDQAFIDACGRALEPTRRKELQDTAYEFVKERTWEKTSRAWMDVLAGQTVTS